MKLKITEEHFDKAVKQTRYFTSNCLIAQAFKTAFPGKRVDVNYHFAEVGKRTFDIPKSLSNLIARFDNLAYVASFMRTKPEDASLARLRASLPRTFEVKEI
jgi:hypothetical protein